MLARAPEVTSVPFGILVGLCFCEIILSCRSERDFYQFFSSRQTRLWNPLKLAHHIRNALPDEKNANINSATPLRVVSFRESIC